MTQARHKPTAERWQQLRSSALRMCRYSSDLHCFLFLPRTVQGSILKGPGSIRGFFGLRFSENLKFLCLVYLYIIKATHQSYLDYAQQSVCMFTVAMETPTNKVKMTFFTFFFILLLFSKLLLKISIPHHTRTNTKLLL